MNIEILHETEHYVLIKAPLLSDGSMPTQKTILPLLEDLREHGFRFLCLNMRLDQEPEMICERFVPKALSS